MIVRRKMQLSFQYNDGGRSKAGYKGSAGDCVTRAIAIALELPYKQVYDDLVLLNKEYEQTHRDRKAKALKSRGSSPRDGVFKEVYRKYLENNGWEWVSIMGIGTGCRVHMLKSELPSGRIIVRLSRHSSTIIDGIVHDTFNPSRGGTRAVYGYFRKV